MTRTLLTIRQTEGQVVALRAATKLCNLEVQTGSAVESGRILAEIYEGFTEGFETAVLVEAKRVLDQRQG